MACIKYLVTRKRIKAKRRISKDITLDQVSNSPQWFSTSTDDTITQNQIHDNIPIKNNLRWQLNSSNLEHRKTTGTKMRRNYVSMCKDDQEQMMPLPKVNNQTLETNLMSSDDQISVVDNVRKDNVEAPINKSEHIFYAWPICRQKHRPAPVKAKADDLPTRRHGSLFENVMYKPPLVPLPTFVATGRNRVKSNNQPNDGRGPLRRRISSPKDPILSKNEVTVFKKTGELPLSFQKSQDKCQYITRVSDDNNANIWLQESDGVENNKPNEIPELWSKAEQQYVIPRRVSLLQMEPNATKKSMSRVGNLVSGAFQTFVHPGLRERDKNKPVDNKNVDKVCQLMQRQTLISDYVDNKLPSKQKSLINSLTQKEWIISTDTLAAGRAFYQNISKTKYNQIIAVANATALREQAKQKLCVTAASVAGDISSDLFAYADESDIVNDNGEETNEDVWPVATSISDSGTHNSGYMLVPSRRECLKRVGRPSGWYAPELPDDFGCGGSNDSGNDSLAPCSIRACWVDGLAVDEFHHYHQTISRYLCKKDLLHMSKYQPNFLSRSKITPSTRATMCDWLIKVQQYLKLRTESLHLAVGLVDSYLWSKSFLPAACYQLVGITALFVAVKYVERFPPTTDTLCYLTEHSFKPKEVIEFECSFLQELDFQINFPLPCHFLNRALLACNDLKRNEIETLELFCLYMFDLSLTEIGLVGVSASLRCAGALLLGRLMLLRFNLQDKQSETEAKTQIQNAQSTTRSASPKESDRNAKVDHLFDISTIWPSGLAACTGHQMQINGSNSLRETACVYARALSQQQPQHCQQRQQQLNSNSVSSQKNVDQTTPTVSEYEAATHKYSNRRYSKIATWPLISTCDYTSLLEALKTDEKFITLK